MDTLIATAFAALFAGCWVMEMRSSRKMREGHTLECKRLREEHIRELAQERSTSWKEGVRMGSEARRQLRYDSHKAGRFA